MYIVKMLKLSFIVVLADKYSDAYTSYSQSLPVRSHLDVTPNKSGWISFTLVHFLSRIATTLVLTNI